MPDDTTEPGPGGPDVDMRAADGRIPGSRGLATRQRLLDATESELETTGYRDLKVVEIARGAGTSPATFYQYFPSAEAAVLVLAAELTEAWHADLEHLITNRDWADYPDNSSRVVVDGFIEFWTRHKAILKVLDLASMEGDYRFRDLRTWLLNGATLIDVAETHGQRRGDPKAVAAVLIAMLAHVANHRPGLERWGVDHDALVDTMAGIIGRTLIG